MNIITLLNQIENKEIVLPAIQRDFVWGEDKIQTLMDSIARGYPIGIVLMWETYEDIQYRYFQKEYFDDGLPIFYNNTQKQKLKVVLDGQQRLQSLYIALYGRYEGKSLYFDVLSGKSAGERKYYFYFLKDEDAKKRNSTIPSPAKNGENGRDNSHELEHLVKVADLFNMTASNRIKLRKELVKALCLAEEDELRLETNLAKLDEVLVKDENILKASTIDENKPSNSPERNSEADVLEIFVRINRQGTPLTRSDLIFSMLKLNWKASAVSLPDFVDTANARNSFALDVDFVIRCLFAVSDLGTKFDIDLLRSKSNINLIQDNYEKCCNAIFSTVDFVQRDCWIASSKALGSYNTLVPFVYYLYHTPKHEVPNSEISNFRKALFWFGFTLPFSRYADFRLGKFIREELKPNLEKKNYHFPIEAAIKLVRYWDGIKDFDLDVLQRNSRLALYLLQNYSGIEPHLAANFPDIDHIFPRTELRKKGYGEAEINNIANYWILSKGKNQNKSAKDPKIYFADVDNAELRRAKIYREMLRYEMYKIFIRDRGPEILTFVKEKIGFTGTDFETES